jgi:hypothetical protein
MSSECFRYIHDENRNKQFIMRGIGEYCIEFCADFMIVTKKRKGGRAGQVRKMLSVITPNKQKLLIIRSLSNCLLRTRYLAFVINRTLHCLTL